MKIGNVIYLLIALAVSPISVATECPYDTTEEYWHAAEKIYIGTVQAGRYEDGIINYEIKVIRNLKGSTENVHSLKASFGANYPLTLAAKVIVFEDEDSIMPCSPSGEINLKLAHTKRADIEPERIKFAKEILRLIANDS